MWSRKLIKNKIIAIAFIAVGVASVFIEYDATFFIFTLMIGIPLLFTKDNWID